MKIADVMPLTPVQEGLLYASTLTAEGADPYTVQAELILTGELDPALLHRSAQAVFERHPNLRACYRRRKNGMPVALVLDGAEIGWAEHDLTTESDPEAAWRRLCDDDRDVRFDPAQPPLLRLTLGRLPGESWRLLVTNHHLILDGWSSPSVVYEIFQTYAAGGDPAGLPVRRPFRDFLAWLDAQDRDGALDRWRRALGDEPAATLLAPDAADLGTRPVEHRLPDLGDLGDRLAVRARETGLTVGTLMQTAWGLALATELGRSEALLGTVVSGRSPELEGAGEIIGMTLGTIPIRVAAAPADTVLDVAGRVQAAQTAVMDDHWVGLPAIAGAVGLGEMFDSLLVFENHATEAGPLQQAVAAAGLHLDAVAPRDSTHYPLTVQVLPGAQLQIRLHCLPGAVSEDRLERLGRTFAAALIALADRPTAPVAGLTALTETERAELTALGDGGPARAGGSLGALPADAAGTRVRCGDDELTYGELDRRIEALTERLRSAGIGPEAIVALALPRSLETLVAVPAILRSGAAVLPLDLEYPAELTEFVLRDAQPALIIADPELSLPAGLTVPRLVIGDPAADPAPATVARPVVRGENPAYLIYTSGSTGRPKGVLGTRQALADRLAWAHELWPPTSPDVRLIKSSLSFIDGLTELLAALRAGAEIVFATDIERTDPLAQARLIETRAVTTVTAVPSLATELAALAPEACRGLHRWVLSGEALTGDVAQRLRPAGAAAASTLINSYGSSEVAGDVTFETIAAQSGETVPIGRPVPGVVVHLLDDALRPVPRGTVGEIYVASAQLARGYLGRADLTAETFLANPFGGGRLYRTRDLGCWDAHGRLEFHGRVDGQVKIRGHRVETVGVEAALRELTGVSGAAVVARPDTGGSAALWAYVTVTGAELDAAQIRQSLRRTLPDYQLPAVVVLGELPALPNGKVNRRALLDLPRDPDSAAAQQGPAPAAGTQSRLAELFAELLGLDAVHAGTDFFAAGGHSLLATRLVHRLAVEDDRTVSVRTVFDHPTVAALAAVLDSGADTGDAAPDFAALRPRPLPATAAQRRLWALDRLHREATGAGAHAYNLAFVVELDGLLDLPTLTAAAVDLADRHESLRTLLVADDDGALHQQILSTGTPVPVTVHRGPEAAAALEDSRNRPFELDREAPLRMDLAELAEERRLLQVLVHHIAGDEWSTPLLFADLAAAYRRRLLGDEAAPAAPVVQYADAAGWQERALETLDADGHSLRTREREYWREALAGLPDELPLPYDRPRPAQADGRGAAVAFEIDADTAGRLAELARTTGSTGFMLVHTALVALFARLTGGTDIPLGTPVANRTHPALQDVIGMFTNTMVLRARVDGDPTVADLLADLRELDLTALDHQLLPFQEVVDAVDPPREVARSPLFQTLLQYRPPVVEPEFPGCTAQIRFPATTTAKFDLTIEFLENGPGKPLSGRIEYATALFDAATVERLAQALVRVLQASAADPQTRISALPVLTAADREALDRFAATAHPVDTEQDLTGLIAAAAQANPELPAVLGAGGELSYRQLIAAAETLAGRLVAAGVGVDQVVAVDLPRRPALSVAVLAAHRAGAAYLPLDRDHPAQRRAFILADAAPAAVLTDDPEFAGTDGVPVILLDPSGRPVTDGESGPLPDPGTLPAGRAAYLIYTSGSTGTPKAVVVEHRAIVNRLLWMQHRYGLQPGERVLHKTPTGFDVSVWELFWPLLTGATLVMAEPGAHRDPAAIAATLDRYAVTTVHFVPSLLRAFLAETDDALPALRRILCSGEALTAPLRDGVRERFTQVRLHNLYGPTEAAVDVTELDVTDTTGPVVPIGGPVWNTGLHVLGPRLEELPIGVWGDLYLSGRQLARGYAGRAELTARTFVAGPYGVPGERMYRTGDIARWTAAGVLEYAGRSDGQLKLRGQRIEPGEIEQALLATGALRQAVCLGHTTADGRTMLVAYGVPADPAVTAEPVLAEIAGVLPAHLVPGTLTLLDALPVTSNGKLDARALPDPRVVVGAAADTGELSAEQRALAEVFAEVLAPGQDVAVGTGDDFFALGGDSIVAITVVNRLRRRGFALEVKDIFEHRTVGALGGLLRPAETEESAAQTERDRPLPLTPIVAQLAARSGRWQSLAQSMTVVVPEGITVPELQTALDAVLARHEALRLRVQLGAGGVWTVQPLPAAELPAAGLLTEHTFAEQPGETDYAAVAAATHAALDPEAGGCLRAALITAPGVRRLLLVIHHLGVDAVSWRILLDDLADAAEAVRAGRAADLPPVPVGYGEYTDAVAALATDPATMKELATWRGLLAGTADPASGTAPGTQADLLTGTVEIDAPATANYLAADSVTAALVADIGAAVNDWRVSAGAEPAPLLLDVEGHGRDLGELNLSRTVGWLTTVAPVRWEHEPAAGATVAEQLDRPRHAYGLLRYANARTARALAPAPRAQILVNYLGGMRLGAVQDWQPAPEARWTRTRPASDLSADYALTIDARVEHSASGDGRLIVDITCSGQVFTESDRRSISQAITDRLGSGAALKVQYA